MYLWCANCCHAHLRSNWMIKNVKYGVCPSCGCSEYRNALSWETIAQANSYPMEPNSKETYPIQSVLF